MKISDLCRFEVKVEILLHELCDFSITISVRGTDGPSLSITTYLPFGLNAASKYVDSVMLQVKQSCFRLSAVKLPFKFVE